MNASQRRQAYFESLYGDSIDPYGLRTRWYEARKRAVLLAALPHQRYGNAYEPGCGIGELTVQLATRCERLLASDFDSQALTVARERNAGLPQVTFERHVLPQDWPAQDNSDAAKGRFDLIILSELGYFLDAQEMRTLAHLCDVSLSPGGTLVACDWRSDFDGRVLPTWEVHAMLAGLGMPCVVRHEEDDFTLQIWSHDARSVAQQEGIR